MYRQYDYSLQLYMVRVGQTEVHTYERYDKTAT